MSDTQIDLLGEIERRCGREAALRLADRFGGLRIYIPRAAGPTHRLRLALGDAVVDVLIELAGGEEIIVPRGRGLMKQMRMATIRDLAEAGKGTDEIAEAVGVTRRYVRLLLAGSGQRK